MGESDPVLEDEVKYRYYTIIQLYRRATLQDNAQRYCFRGVVFFLNHLCVCHSVPYGCFLFLVLLHSA
jgi:hypothetical protein